MAHAINVLAKVPARLPRLTPTLGSSRSTAERSVSPPSTPKPPAYVGFSIGNAISVDNYATRGVAMNSSVIDRVPACDPRSLPASAPFSKYARAAKSITVGATVGAKAALAIDGRLVWVGRGSTCRKGMSAAASRCYCATRTRL
jgi:hypothetical protein